MAWGHSTGMTVIPGEASFASSSPLELTRRALHGILSNTHPRWQQAPCEKWLVKSPKLCILLVTASPKLHHVHKVAFQTVAGDSGWQYRLCFSQLELGGEGLLNKSPWVQWHLPKYLLSGGGYTCCQHGGRLCLSWQMVYTTSSKGQDLETLIWVCQRTSADSQQCTLFLPLQLSLQYHPDWVIVHTLAN